MSSARVMVAGAGLAATLAVSTANADMTKEECVKANADGQALRLDGKLDAARTLLEACGDASCPGIVREDCAQRVAELNRAQPTIAFDVTDTTGADIGAVRITVDGRPLRDGAADGPMRVDPGEHVFVFTVRGRVPVVRRFVFKEGERDRHEHIFLEPQAPAPAASDTTTTPSDTGTSPPRDTASSARETRNAVAYVTGGVGLASIALGGVLGVLTLSAVNAQKTDCASVTSCPNHTQAMSDHSTASTDSTISDVGFIVGGALVVGAAVLLFTGPSAGTMATPRTGVRWVPAVGPGGARLLFRGEF